MATEMRDKSPVIAPGHTSGTITDKISMIIQSGTPKWFFVAFGISFLLLMMFPVLGRGLVRQGCRHLGHQHSGGLGIRHHQTSCGGSGSVTREP